MLSIARVCRTLADMSRSGPELALLLLSGFRALADRATDELAARGYEDVRPVHDFALRAILSGADDASRLGRATGVTKQAAAKTVAVLESRGYVTRQPDAADARRMRLEVTPRGREMLAVGEAIFDGLRAEWEARVGRAKIATLESALRAIVGDRALRPEGTDWPLRDLG